MDDDAFRHRFDGAEELGRLLLDDGTLIFRDNGTDVGVWRSKRVGSSSGRLLSHAEAVSVRFWWLHQDARLIDLTSPAVGPPPWCRP